MVRTVADRLFSRLIEAFPADRAYSRAGFDRESMPRPVAGYLEHVLRLRLDAEEDRLRSFSGDWFDVDHAEVRNARREYVAGLSRHQRIPAAAWQEELRRACEDVVWYLVQPARALTDVVFRDSKGLLQIPEIFRRLRYFNEYPYFSEVLAAYAEQKNLEQLDRDRFAQLLQRIDRQLTDEYGAEEWLDLLAPLMDVLRSVPVFDGRLPVRLAAMFFAEKEAQPVVRSLQAMYGDDADQLLAREDLLEVLRSPVHRVEEPAKPQSRNVVEAHVPQAADGPLPLWKQYEHRQDGAPRAGDEAGDGASEPLWKQFHRTPTATAAAPEPRKGPADLSALERAVLGERGARNRELFIKHLFSGSSDDYKHALNRLRTAPNWTQASQIIAEEVFLKHQVNIYSEPAVTFTDAAEAKFRA